MAWVQADLDALETAIKVGARRVEFKDRAVTYHSLDEMLRLRDAMKQTINTTAGNTTLSTYGSFYKD